MQSDAGVGQGIWVHCLEKVVVTQCVQVKELG